MSIESRERVAYILAGVGLLFAVRGYWVSLSNFRGTSDLELPSPSYQFRALALLGLNL